MGRKMNVLCENQRRALLLGQDIRMIRGMKAKFKKFYKANVLPQSCDMCIEICGRLEAKVRENYACEK